MILTSTDKGLAYQISYWITALLPVLLGFGLTMLMVWYFTKHYKGPNEDENIDELEEDEFVKDDD